MLANALSSMRLVLAPAVVAALLYASAGEVSRWVPAVLFLLAAATDLVDGYLARHGGKPTLLGTLLDPVADKALICATLLVLAVRPVGQRIPVWLVATVVAREVFVMAGAVAFLLKGVAARVRPPALGKVSTAVLMGTVLAGLLLPAGHPVFPVLFPLAWVLVVASGLQILRYGMAVLGEADER